MQAQQAQQVLVDGMRFESCSSGGRGGRNFLAGVARPTGYLPRMDDPLTLARWLRIDLYGEHAIMQQCEIKSKLHPVDLFVAQQWFSDTV